MKKQNIRFQLFLITLAFIGSTRAGKLCDFAERFPSKGKHCYNPDDSETQTSLEYPPEILKKSSTTIESDTVQLCPINMVYKHCSDACYRTCEAPGQCQDGVCTQAEDCVCDDGFFMKGSDCVPQEECGCYEAEAQTVIANGDVYVNHNCSRRSNCTNNQLHVEESYRCSDVATCDERSGIRRCYCNTGFGGDGVTCIRMFSPKDCHELYLAGTNGNGVYTIYPDGYPDGIQVYCEMERNEGGWTVIQRRSNASVDFYRTWNEYKDGFEHPSRDHWLGNDYIHAMTTQKTYSLRIDLTDSDGSSYYALYSSFNISDDSDKYRLSIGSYSGDSGYDAMSWHNNRQFSTRDQDNDEWSDFDCAERHQGAWWFGNLAWYRSNPKCLTDTHCEYFPVDSGCAECGNTHLNADFDGSTRGTNIFWDSLSGEVCGIRYTEMKIRPIP